MNAFLSLGRWFFAVPFGLFGLQHFWNAQVMEASVVPAFMPAKIVWVYLAGAGLVAAAVSIVAGKYDKLGATLLALFLLSLVLMIHLPGTLGGSEGSMLNLLKDLSLAGAAMMYARHLAQDKSIIG